MLFINMIHPGLSCNIQNFSSRAIFEVVCVGAKILSDVFPEDKINQTGWGKEVIKKRIY